MSRICRPCWLDGTAACLDPDETCVAAALIAAPADACLDLPLPLPAAGEFCGLPAHDPGDPCGPLALCLSLEQAPACFPLCRVAVGDLGTPAHPDCPLPTDTCAEVAPDLAYGRCRPAP